MAVIFAGGEMDAFSFAGNVTITTSTSRFDSAFARMAMIPRLTGTITANFTAQTEAWLHVSIEHNVVANNSNDDQTIELIDSATGQVVVQIDGDNGVYNLEYWNGAGFSELAPNIAFINDVLHKIDLHWKIADSGGIFEVYLDGTLVSSFSGDTLRTNFTQIDRLRISSPAPLSASSSFDVYFSEIIVATEETIGWHLATVAPDGVGNSTTWTGDNTDVSAAAVNDSTFVSSANAEEVEQFTVGNLSGAAALLDVEAVVVAARSRNAASGPQNLQISVRTGGSDFFSSNLSGVSTGFTPGFE